ncbi:MAG: hypothetical protein IPJ87_00980 [Flavobacteriales bacterium]|nr:hypothetical protein [Flavobacteriales bacterium]MBK7940449.1 hypothetical protein [Flavobacteriales bacterium]MBK8950187.1 hypothetical protein [Flavobacteriales bacterium]MBK9699392.1 hypothetical protein [Flavobacteriales bacterium]
MNGEPFGPTWKVCGNELKAGLTIDQRIGLPVVDPWSKALRIGFRGWHFGSMTIPLRLRPATLSLAPSLVKDPSIALFYGHTRGYGLVTHRAITNYSITAAPFIGLTVAELKTSTVVQNSPAIMLGGGFVLARNNLGIMLTVGMDQAVGNHTDKWIYQGKPWFGLGVSASLGYQ